MSDQIHNIEARRRLGQLRTRMPIFPDPARMADTYVYADIRGELPNGRGSLRWLVTEAHPDRGAVAAYHGYVARGEHVEYGLLTLRTAELESLGLAATALDDDGKPAVELTWHHLPTPRLVRELTGGVAR